MEERAVPEAKPPAPLATSRAQPHKLTQEELREDPFNSPSLVDISRGGAGLRAPISGLSKGDRVKLTLYCFGDQRFDFDAEVRWTKVPKGKQYMLFGIQFDSLIDMADVDKISRSAFRTRYRVTSLARAA